MTTASQTPDTLRAEDARARSLAQREFVRPLVVEAGAGTGKTATLVARVLAWTLGPGWERAARELSGAAHPAGAALVAQGTLRGVVAITFTDAAAAEMAERVGEGMRGVAQGGLPDGVDPEALPASTEVRAERARALLECLDLLEVRTIHAWCARLLQDQAVVAGLHPAFQVDADGAMREAVVREVVERALIQGLGEQPDPDLEELAVQGHGPDALVEAVLALLEQGVDPADLPDDPWGHPQVAPLIDALVTGLRALAGALQPLHALRRPTNLRRLAEALDELVPELHAGMGLESARAVAAALLGDHGGALDALRRGKLNKSEAEALGDAAPLVILADGPVRRLRWLGDLDVDAGRRALRVVRPVASLARARLRAMGALGFSELLAEAARLLASQPQAADKVRAGLRQLLVDEFQDTDPSQCEIVARLALEGPEGQRPGLFIVGDPKQSIYGWRSADLRAYESFVERVRAAGGWKVSLVVNFRSVPAVLQAVEGAVRPVMRREVGRQPAFQPLLPCGRLQDAPGHLDAQRRPVECWATWSWEDHPDGTHVPAPKQLRPAARLVEVQAVARDIHALGAAGVGWSRIAILFRSSGDLPLLVQALREAGVPYAVERDKSYFQRREVAEAAALVAAVAAPHDHVALVAWLRSGMVGVPDAALLPLWRQGLPQLLSEASRPDAETVRSLRLAVARAKQEVDRIATAVPGLERVAGWEHSLVRALEDLLALRVSLQHDPADVFVDRLRHQGGLELAQAGRFLGAFRLANLDRLLRGLLDGLLAGGDLHAVLRHLREGLAGQREGEEGRPPEAAQDAVQLMTIHKSKGLGFDHVYVIGLDKGSAAGRRPATGFRDASAWRLLGQASPGQVAAEEEAERVAAAEQVRLLYVAMTRAKQRLVLTGLWPFLPLPVDPAQADTAMELLGGWEGLPADLVALATRLPPGVDRDVVAGIGWAFPGRVARAPAAPAGRAPGGSDAPGLVDPERVAGDARRLQAERQQAARRMLRPWTQGPSSLSHRPDPDAADEDRAREAAQAREVDPGPPDAAALAARAAAVEQAASWPLDPQAVATGAGTAVHRVLENLDLGAADLGAALAREGLSLPARLAAEHPEPLARAIAARAAGLLDRLAAGPLLPRLRALRDAVVARELDLLMPPPAGDAGPVGAVVGAIDLVYRDPGDGALVVADYKTDEVEGEALDARVVAYGPQLRTYCRALQEALDLPAPPRGELWFLHAGQVRVVG
ncbi:UvrD-helicase domain-containing protein [Myxococcota bacterium]|nr:UvrD-helicase domain-containing protein [Myxococcota bacterium]